MSIQTAYRVVVGGIGPVAIRLGGHGPLCLPAHKQNIVTCTDQIPLTQCFVWQECGRESEIHAYYGKKFAPRAHVSRKGWKADFLSKPSQNPRTTRVWDTSMYVLRARLTLHRRQKQTQWLQRRIQQKSFKVTKHVLASVRRPDP